MGKVIPDARPKKPPSTAPVAEQLFEVRVAIGKDNFTVGTYSRPMAEEKAQHIAKTGLWVGFRWYLPHSITAIDMEPIPNGQAPT